METRRKRAFTARAQPQGVPECDTSDAESVATLAAFEDGGCDDSDYDVQKEKVGQAMSRKRLVTSSAKRSATGVPRQPTRVPDPNVVNRNALMARENRRRKKELMLTLETENERLTKDLQQLQKLVARQEVQIRGLRNERNYLKSVVANQQEILTLMKRLQNDDSVPAQTHTTSQITTNTEKAMGASTPSSIYSDSGLSAGSSGEQSPIYGDQNNNVAIKDIDNSSSYQMVHQDDDDDNYGTEELLSMFPSETLLNDDDVNLSLISTDLMFSADPFAISGCTDVVLDGFDIVAEDAEEEQRQCHGKDLQRETIRSEHNYVYPSVSLIPHDNTDPVVVVRNPQPLAFAEEDEAEEYQWPAAKRIRFNPDYEADEEEQARNVFIGGGKVSRQQWSDASKRL